MTNEELKERYKKHGLCKECKQPNTDSYWCQLCNAKRFQQNFQNWTSGNKEIDKFIQNMQLNINGFSEQVTEWIPYNQFNDIKEIGKGGFATVYSAIWKDGPLKFDYEIKKEYKRKSDYEVALKCLHNSQNITNEFLNEV